MKPIYVLILLYVGIFACSKKSTTPTDTQATSINPDNLKLASGFYAITLSWNNPNNNSIKKVRIYRDTISSGQTLYREINFSTSFKDELVSLYKTYYYRISFLNEAGEESMKSSEVNGKPTEPVNTNTPINGEIGGINYVYWNFSRQSFFRLTHKFTIFDEPRNQDGSINKDGLYYQFYQGLINDTIGFYYGIQTSVMKPNGDNRKGIIFSRWKTRDTSNYKLAPGGWGQSAGYEGDFIGVRINYEWKAGTYNIEIRKDSTDNKGDWYSLWISKEKETQSTNVGSIRFERSTISSGIKNGGITWTELYFKNDKNTPLPKWHVSIDDIRADSIRPNKATSAYNDKTFIGFSNIFTTNNQDVHFYMGPKVATHRQAGVLWSN